MLHQLECVMVVTISLKFCNAESQLLDKGLCSVFALMPFMQLLQMDIATTC